MSCEESTCDAQLDLHKWGKIKSGWFFTKDGKGYCPLHIPDWVDEWRRKRRAK